MKLKAKFTLIVSVFVVAMLAINAFFIFSHYKKSIKETIARQQFLMISILADEIDSKLLASQQHLIAAAEIVPAGIMQHPETAQAFLDNRPSLHSIFDNHIFLFTPAGKLFVESPYIPGRRGLDFSFRQYILNTVKTKKPYVSDPYVSSLPHKHPAIMFTVPLFDGKGNMTGILGGSVDLMRDNFLGRIGTVRIGKTGYFYLTATDRTMIIHPDKKRILTKVTSGANRLYDRSMEGFEGTDETITSHGTKMVASVKQITGKNWILGANYPEVEAYRPIQVAQRYFLIATLAGITAVFFIISSIIKHLIKPIELLTRHINELPQKTGDDRYLNIDTKDEIGTLSAAFNKMETDRKRVEGTLLEQERYVSALVENSPMATFVLNSSHKITNWNRACEELTGCKGPDMLGTDYHWKPFYGQKRPLLADIILEGSQDKLALLYKSHSKSALNINGIKAEGWYDNVGGKKRYIVFEGAPIFNSKRDLIAAIETLQDITDSKKLEDELIHKALYDSLTGLPNRILLRDRLQNLYDHKKRQPELLFAALFVDLDDFKKVNDTLGHMIGDELLLSATKRLHDAIRPGDTMSRFGGDEFVIVLDSVKNTEDAIKVAQRIHEVLSEAFYLENNELFISSSIGIALSDNGQDNPDALLRNADIAMYCAKGTGKSRHVLFDDSMHAAVLDSVGIENDLRRALKMGEMSVHYQPIVDIRTNKVAGFEALARWFHPVKGYIPPSDFIPVAEKMGLIDEIGELILNKACVDIGNLNSVYSYNPPLYVSVNLSAKQFNNMLPHIVEEILTESGFDGRNLRLEVTESALMENILTASSVLFDIKAMGIQVYLDDFGTGYSSLNYLHKFPVDALKIDPSFTRNIREDKQAMEILKSIFKLANNLDMKMIIEGVESQEALGVFRDLDFHFLQGYVFSKPVPSEKLSDLINESGLITYGTPGPG